LDHGLTAPFGYSSRWFQIPKSLRFSRIIFSGIACGRPSINQKAKREKIANGAV